MSSSIPITPIEKQIQQRSIFAQCWCSSIPSKTSPPPHPYHCYLINTNSMSHLCPCLWFPHQSMNLIPDSQVKLSYQPGLRLNRFHNRVELIVAKAVVPNRSWEQPLQLLTPVHRNHWKACLACCPYLRELETSLPWSYYHTGTSP